MTASALSLPPLVLYVVIIEPGTIATDFGNIMTEPMLKRSGQGPYGRLAQAMAKSAPTTPMSPPDLVANAIVTAVNTSRPKTRYVAGSMARPLMFIRKYFGDRLYDRVIMSQFSRALRETAIA